MNQRSIFRIHAARAGFARAIVCSLAGLACLAPQKVSAQSSESYGDEISLHVGSLLPNQIEGVTEILPVFGGRYGFSTSNGAIEVGVSNSHASGVDFTTFTASLKGETPLADQLHGLLYGGLDFNYYRPINESSRKTATGLHIGTGLMMYIANSLWLRSEVKFMGGPGTSLYLGFGIVFRSSGSGGGGN